MILNSFFFCFFAVLIVPCLNVKIRKCCRKNESFDGQLNCVNTNQSFIRDWIPMNSFIIHSSESTVKISQQNVVKTVKEIYEGEIEFGFPGCSSELRDVAYSWKDPEVDDQYYLIYGIDKSVRLNLKRSSVFHDNATLAFSRAFSPDTYCVERGPHDSFVALICPCSEITCIRKCCFENNVFSEVENKCVSIDTLNFTDAEYDAYNDWRPQFENYGSGVEDDVSNKVEYFLLSGKRPPCASQRGIYKEEFSEAGQMLFLKDGRIRVTNASSKNSIIPAGEVCGELAISSPSATPSPALLRCFPEPASNSLSYLYTGGLFVAGLLLALSAVAASTSEDFDEKRGAKLILGHIACLAVAHFSAVIVQLVSVSDTSPLCVIAGYLMQFSYLAAFFWLNVMCIDMSRTFSGVNGPGSGERSRARRRLIIYSLYAWGGAALFTGAALIADFTPLLPERSRFRPQFGYIKCWFADGASVLTFFYVPVGLLLLSNLGLFLYTTWRIIVLSRGTGALNQEDSGRHGGGGKKGPSNGDRQRFILYAKLFSLMGVTWVTEILSWAIGGPEYIWYLTDTINLLRAVFIFIIFCCKPKIWKALKKKFGGSKILKSLCIKAGNGSKEESPGEPSTTCSTANEISTSSNEKPYGNDIEMKSVK